MGDFQMNLVCCTAVLLDEVAAKGVKRKDVAMTYAMAIVSHANKADVIDWRKVNAAITDRWSVSGLDYIKNLAWKIVEGRGQPQGGVHASR